MKILDFSQGLEQLPITFGRETVTVMAHMPKVLVFEHSNEVDTFGSILEDMDYFIDKHLDLVDGDPDYEYREAASWFVDQCEEESFMVDEMEDGKFRYETRNLTLSKGPEDDSAYDDDMTTRFGVLNSKDTYTPPDVLEKQVHLMKIYAQTEELISQLELDQLTMLTEIIKVFEEDLEAYKAGKIFKVDFPDR